MDERPETIRRMHAADLTESREKLTLFLCGYLNGPELFEQKYGPIRLPAAHRHLAIGTQERDAWLACMKAAIDGNPTKRHSKGISSSVCVYRPNGYGTDPSLCLILVERSFFCFDRSFPSGSIVAVYRHFGLQ